MTESESDPLEAGPSRRALEFIAAQCGDPARVIAFLTTHYRPKRRRKRRADLTADEISTLAGCVRTFKEKRRARWKHTAALQAAFDFAPEFDTEIIRDAIAGDLSPTARALLSQENSDG